jgi:hypothetical protein
VETILAQMFLPLQDAEIGLTGGKDDGSTHTAIGTGAAASPAQTVRQSDLKTHASTMAGTKGPVCIRCHRQASWMS